MLAMLLVRKRHRVVLKGIEQLAVLVAHIARCLVDPWRHDAGRGAQCSIRHGVRFSRNSRSPHGARVWIVKLTAVRSRPCMHGTRRIGGDREVTREIVRVGFHPGDTSESLTFALGIWSASSWRNDGRRGRDQDDESCGTSRCAHRGQQSCEAHWRLGEKDNGVFNAARTFACDGAQ